MLGGGKVERQGSSLLMCDVAAGRVNWEIGQGIQKTPNSVCAVSLRDNNDTLESEFSVL